MTASQPCSVQYAESLLLLCLRVPYLSDDDEINIMHYLQMDFNTFIF